VPKRGRALLLTALLGTVALGVLAQPSVAMTTFSGSCESRTLVHNFGGTKLVPTGGGFTYHGLGHCKGTLNGAPFDGPVQLDIYANMSSVQSCPTGYATDAGPLYYTFLTGGSNAGVPAGAHPASAQTSSAAPAPSLSRARTRVERQAKAHASRRKGHRRKHRKKSRPHRTTPAATSTHAPVTPEPRQNPVLAMWLNEASAGPMVVNYFYGAYRGWATGTAQIETGPENLPQCVNGGNTDLWIRSTMHTITEIRG
jgi:hypothetical protein